MSAVVNNTIEINNRTRQPRQLVQHTYLPKAGQRAYSISCQKYSDIDTDQMLRMDNSVGPSFPQYQPDNHLLDVLFQAEGSNPLTEETQKLHLEGLTKYLNSNTAQKESDLGDNFGPLNLSSKCSIPQSVLPTSQVQERFGFGIPSKATNNQWTVGSSRKVLGSHFHPFPTRGTQHAMNQYFARYTTPKPTQEVFNPDQSLGFQNHDLLQIYKPRTTGTRTRTFHNRRNTTIQPILSMETDTMPALNPDKSKRAPGTAAAGAHRHNSLAPQRIYRLQKDGLRGKMMTPSQGKPSSPFEIQKMRREDGNQRKMSEQKSKINSVDDKKTVNFLNFNVILRKVQQQTVTDTRIQEESRMEHNLEEKSNLAESSRFIQREGERSTNADPVDVGPGEQEDRSPPIYDKHIKYVRPSVQPPTGVGKLITKLQLKAINKERSTQSKQYKQEVGRQVQLNNSTAPIREITLQKVEKNYKSIQKLVEERSQDTTRTQINEQMIINDVNARAWKNGSTGQMGNTMNSDYKPAYTNKQYMESSNQSQSLMAHDTLYDAKLKGLKEEHFMLKTTNLATLDDRVDAQDARQHTDGENSGNTNNTFDNLQKMKNSVNAGCRQVINQEKIKNGYKQLPVPSSVRESHAKKLNLNLVDDSYFEKSKEGGSTFGPSQIQSQGEQESRQDLSNISPYEASIQSPQNKEFTIPWNQNNAYLKVVDREPREATTLLENVGNMEDASNDQEPTMETQSKVELPTAQQKLTPIASESKDTVMVLTQRGERNQVKIANLNKQFEIGHCQQPDAKEQQKEQQRMQISQIKVKHQNFELPKIDISVEQKFEPSVATLRQGSQMSQYPQIDENPQRLRSVSQVQREKGEESQINDSHYQNKFEQYLHSLGRENQITVEFGALKPTTFPIESMKEDDFIQMQQNAEVDLKDRTGSKGRDDGKTYVPTASKVRHIPQNAFMPARAKTSLKPKNEAGTKPSQPSETTKLVSVEQTEMLTEHLQESLHRVLGQFGYIKGPKTVQQNQEEVTNTGLQENSQMRSETPQSIPQTWTPLLNSRLTAPSAAAQAQINIKKAAQKTLELDSEFRNFIAESMLYPDQLLQLKVKQYHLPLGELPQDHHYIEALNKLSNDFKRAKLELSRGQIKQPISMPGKDHLLQGKPNTSDPQTPNFQIKELSSNSMERQMKQYQQYQEQQKPGKQLPQRQRTDLTVFTPMKVGLQAQRQGHMDRGGTKHWTDSPFSSKLDQVKSAQQRAFKDSVTTLDTNIAAQESVQNRMHSPREQQHFENKAGNFMNGPSFEGTDRQQFLNFLCKQQPLVSEMVEQLIVGKQLQSRQEYREKSALGSNAAKRLLLPREAKTPDELRGRQENQTIRSKSNQRRNQELSTMDKRDRSQSRVEEAQVFNPFTNEKILDNSPGVNRILKNERAGEMGAELKFNGIKSNAKERNCKVNKMDTHRRSRFSKYDGESQESQINTGRAGQGYNETMANDVILGAAYTPDDISARSKKETSSTRLSPKVGVAREELAETGLAKLLRVGHKGEQLSGSREMGATMSPMTPAENGTPSPRRQKAIESIHTTTLERRSIGQRDHQNLDSQKTEANKPRAEENQQVPEGRSPEQQRSGEGIKVQEINLGEVEVSASPDANSTGNDTSIQLILQKEGPITEKVEGKYLITVDSMNSERQQRKVMIPKLELEQLAGIQTGDSRQIARDTDLVIPSASTACKDILADNIQGQIERKSQFSIEDFDKQITERIASFQQGGDQPKLKRHQGFKIGGVLLSTANPSSTMSDVTGATPRGQASMTKKANDVASLLRELTNINHPDQVLANKNAIDSFLNNHKIFLPKAMNHKSQTRTRRNNDKQQAFQKDFAAITRKENSTDDIGVSIKGRTMNASSNRADMYRVAPANLGITSLNLGSIMNHNDVRGLSEKNDILNGRSIERRVRQQKYLDTVPCANMDQVTSLQDTARYMENQSMLKHLETDRSTPMDDTKDNSKLVSKNNSAGMRSKGDISIPSVTSEKQDVPVPSRKARIVSQLEAERTEAIKRRRKECSKQSGGNTDIELILRSSQEPPGTVPESIRKAEISIQDEQVMASKVDVEGA